MEGKVLGARFALREELDHDIPGIQRFLAHDDRLDRATVVDLIDSPEAGAVRNVATRASRLRDPRLARVVATGAEELDGVSVTYIASEHVPGSRLDTVLAERVLDPRRAVAVVGGAARALAAARAEDLHHGILRPRCITVTERGRVVVAGVGIEAAVAARAGIPTDPSEHGDARVLGEILIRALTGVDVAAATEADLPDALAARPRRLAAQILAGDGPRSLDQVIVSLSPFDSRALVGFSSVWPVLDLTPEKERERLESEERAATAAEAARQERLAATREMLDEDTLPAAEAAVAAAVAVEHASPELQETVRQIEEHRVETGEQPEVAPEPPTEDALPPGAHVQPDGAADKYEAGFDTLEIMVAAQNVTRDQSTWELVLERLSARWPRSRSLARSLERAQERANSGGPLDGSRIVMLLAVIGVVAAVMLAWSLLDSPLDPSIRIEIDPTFTPAGDVGTASPGPSPSTG